MGFIKFLAVRGGFLWALWLGVVQGDVLMGNLLKFVFGVMLVSVLISTLGSDAKRPVSPEPGPIGNTVNVVTINVTTAVLAAHAWYWCAAAFRVSVVWYAVLADTAREAQAKIAASGSGSDAQPKA